MSPQLYQADASSLDAEDIREQEFYSYYEPLLQLSKFNGTTHGPSAPRDPALSSFCQLGALRLNCRRAVLSFFDRDTQYVLAESTRTMSVVTGSVATEDDTLWLGPTTVPRGNSVCEYTADPSMTWDLVDHFEGPPVRVIADLAEHEQFKHKSFVTHSPFLRFYAGVPIVTSNGTAIGAYCVLDDAPRAALEPWEISMLKDMSVTVMAHLEMVKAMSENQRSRRMVRGLSSFMHGSASLKDWIGDPELRSRRRRQTSAASDSRPDSAPPTTALSRPVTPVLARLKHAHTSGETVPITNEDGIKSWKQRLIDQAGSASPGSRRSSTASTNPQEETLSSTVRSMFGRAATNLQEAVQVDGALFLDASIGYFGGLINPEVERRISHASTTSESNHALGLGGLHIGDGPRVYEEHNAMVLGQSISHDQGTLIDRHSNSNMSDEFLQTLLKRYPRGRTWRFSSAETLDSEQLGVIPEFRPTSTLSMSFTKLSSQKANRKSLRIKEQNTLQRLFPGVRYLALVGLWDSRRDRWFAASIIWTCNPLRMFSSEHELPYLAAFGDSIMAEISRLDVKMAEQAKTDVLSSISHELRSPLHGILGCAECLQDTQVDAYQLSLIHTAETCGKTLLDTIDHLLDHAKISHPNEGYRPPQNADGSENGPVDPFSSENEDDLLGDTAQIESGIDLSLLVEQVVETAFAGHDYLRTAQVIPGLDQGVTGQFIPSANGASLTQKVDGTLDKSGAGSTRQVAVQVILDIQTTVDCHWVLKTEAGAWNRLLLNLVNNSLKYTQKGFVKVTLETTSMPGSNDEQMQQVTLTVADSGIGMGADFIQNQLFTPFAQENPLAPGTGLGMSLVRNIVHKMGGSINVDSVKNIGTMVQVVIPNLARSVSRRSTDEQAELRAKIIERSNTHLNFFGLNTQDTSPHPKDPRDADNAPFLFKESFRRLCRDWYGIDLSFSVEPEPADMYIITSQSAHDYRAKVGAMQHGHAAVLTDKPLLILCDATSVARRMTNPQVFAALSRFTEYVPQPCGPRKLMNVLNSCFERMEAGEQDYASQESTEPGSPTLEGDRSVRKSLAHILQQRPELVTEQSLLGVDEVALTSTETFGGLAYRPQVGGIDTPMGGNHSADEKPAGPGVSNASDTSLAEQQNRPSLLLVEDNAVNMQLLVAYARKNKHNYAVATNGLEALEVYKAGLNTPTKAPNPSPQSPIQQSPDMSSTSTLPQSFDFVFMDISMPVMDGLESTRQIREFERKEGAWPANIIALTALASSGARQEAYLSGIDEFFTKPIRLKELTEILKKDGKSRKSMSPRVD